MPRVYTSLPLAERLVRRTNVNGPIMREDLGPCHVWTGGLTGEGYGALSIGSRSDGSRRTVGAHILAFFVAHGRWADPCALHHCDHKPCVKAVADDFGPAHIFEGTALDNMRDMVSKRRHYAHNHSEFRRGELNPYAKLTEADVVLIRSSPKEMDSSLSDQLDVAVSTVQGVRSGRRWGHVKS